MVRQGNCKFNPVNSRNRTIGRSLPDVSQNQTELDVRVPLDHPGVDQRLVEVAGLVAGLAVAEHAVGVAVCSFCSEWRATADEDGHYCFAVAL
jgi:hypothetical protein